MSVSSWLQMKPPLVAMLLLFAVPAQAAKCYHHEYNEDWTLTVNDPGVLPEFILKQDGEITTYETGSAGTGSDRRYAVDEDGNTQAYRYVGDVLLLDYEAYYPGCKSDLAILGPSASSFRSATPTIVTSRAGRLPTKAHAHHVRRSLLAPQYPGCAAKNWGYQHVWRHHPMSLRETDMRPQLWYNSDAPYSH